MQPPAPDHDCAFRQAYASLQRKHDDVCKLVVEQQTLLHEQADLAHTQRGQVEALQGQVEFLQGHVGRVQAQNAELLTVAQNAQNVMIETQALATSYVEQLARAEQKQAELMLEHAKKVAELETKLKGLERRMLGRSSEKMPPPERLLNKPSEEQERAAREKRRANAEAKSRLETEVVLRQIADGDMKCPKCSAEVCQELPAEEEITYSYVPGRFVRRVHKKQRLACRCGQHTAIARVPEKVFERSPYEAGFIAWLIVQKCADSIPLYRIEKGFARYSIPISRATMNELVHKAAEELLWPLYQCLLERVRVLPIVLADETSMRLQTRKEKRGFVWVFSGRDEGDNDAVLVAYVFSGDRSGETPAKLLGGTQGTLVVDGYTGYNTVIDVDERERSGCLAHCRRKFFEALPTAPEAQEVLDMILDVYRVEHEVLELKIVRSPQHLRLRQQRAGPIMDKLQVWLEAKQGECLPKSPMGTAIGYALNQWTHLTKFLTDARIPVDNNFSEGALRRVALGRKNYLFFGHKRAGRNFAALYSLVATCEANAVEPVRYLTDVLARVQTHPADRIDELLPHRWAPAVRE